MIKRKTILFAALLLCDISLPVLAAPVDLSCDGTLSIIIEREEMVKEASQARLTISEDRGTAAFSGIQDVTFSIREDSTDYLHTSWENDLIRFFTINRQTLDMKVIVGGPNQLDFWAFQGACKLFEPKL